MVRRTAGFGALGVIIVAIWACEPEPPAAPQLLSDRDSLGFGLEFGSGAFVGTSVADTLILSNGGLEDLVISSLDVSGYQYPAGGDAFRVNPDVQLPLTIPFDGVASVQVFFEPMDAGVVDGGMTIISNAENTPSKLIPLWGRGVPQ